MFHYLLVQEQKRKLNPDYLSIRGRLRTTGELSYSLNLPWQPFNTHERPTSEY